MTSLYEISAYAMPGINITSEIVFNVIVKRFPNIDPDLLPTKIRERDYVFCRSLIWAFTDMVSPLKSAGARKLSTTKLGLIFNRDHATVLHNFKTLVELYDSCKRTRSIIDNLRNVLLIDRERFEKWYKESSELKHHNYSYLN